MDGSLVARDDLRLRMIYRSRFLADRLAKSDYLIAFREILFHVGSVPPAAVQPRRAVVEYNFEYGFLALREPFYSHRDNFAARCDWFPQANLSDRPKTVSVLVPGWAMQKQLFDGADTQTR